MSVYNISMLSGNVFTIIQNINVMSGNWLGLFIVYIPAIITFIISLRQIDDVSESLLVSLVLVFALTIVVRLMSMINDFFVIINILLLALVSGYVYYRGRS